MDPITKTCSLGWLTKTYLQQFCTHIGRSLEHLPEAIYDRDEWRVRVRKIHVRLDDYDDRCSVSQKWVHPSYFCRYLSISLHGITLTKWHFDSMKSSLYIYIYMYMLSLNFGSLFHFYFARKYMKHPVVSLVYIYACLSYLPNPSVRAGYDTRSIFKRSSTGLNSQFSFF